MTASFALRAHAKKDTLPSVVCKGYHHAAYIGYAQASLNNSTSAEKLPLVPARPVLFRLTTQDLSKISTLIREKNVSPSLICCKWTLYTALHIATVNDDHQAMDMLFKLGADVNARAWDGSTPLMLAVCAGHPRAVRMLLGRGAYVDFTAHREIAEDVSPLVEAVGYYVRYRTAETKEIAMALLSASATLIWSDKFTNELDDPTRLAMQSALAEVLEAIKKARNITDVPKDDVDSHELENLTDES